MVTSIQMVEGKIERRGRRERDKKQNKKKKNKEKDKDKDKDKEMYERGMISFNGR